MDCFKALLLIARPAAGKSEVIHFLKQISRDQRIERFHIGAFDELDDFPMLWTWLEEDALLEKMGHPRLHTTPDGYFKETYFWDLLIERINLDYTKLNRDFEGETILIEFSRGAEHGGYARAFDHLSDEVLRQMAILYIDVSWEESLLKNRRRFNPDRPDSILEHGLPDEKLEKLYRETDWHDLISDHDAFIEQRGMRIPFVNFDNADDVTTRGGAALGDRLAQALSILWERYHRIQLTDTQR